MSKPLNCYTVQEIRKATGLSVHYICKAAQALGLLHYPLEDRRVWVRQRARPVLSTMMRRAAPQDRRRRLRREERERFVLASDLGRVLVKAFALAGKRAVADPVKELERLEEWIVKHPRSRP